MSHFTLTVKLTAERIARHELAARNTAEAAAQDGEGPILPSRHHIIKAALAEMLEPYNEEGGQQSFVDEEDHERKRWETESTTRVRTPDDCAEVEVPFRDTYPTFEAYCADWLGQKPDPTTGRIGHWTNGEAKWDWWEIGGRWTGFYPLQPGIAPVCGETGPFGDKPEPGRGDIVRFSDLDLDGIATMTRERAETFHREWSAWCAAPTNNFDSPRSRALRIGLCRVTEGPAEPGDDEIVIPWALHVPPSDPRAPWNDVCRVPDLDTFLAEYIDHFNPVTTYAALDDDGWHAPGEMGWFGCSTDTPDEKGAFVKAFFGKFVKTAQPDDLLVIVDCHI